MAFGWDDAVALLFIGGEFVYHRWLEPEQKISPARSVSIPRVDEGAPYPLIYGRCRVKAPILAWVSDPVFVGQDDNIDPDSLPMYFMDMLFVLGLPFRGNATNRIHTMYVGECAMQRETPSNANLSDLNGAGGFEDTGDGGDAIGGHRYVELISPTGISYSTYGAVEFLNGSESQQLVDTTTPFAATTEAGKYMSRTYKGQGGTASWGSNNGTLDPSLIPGYRGMMCAFLYNKAPTINDPDNERIRHWFIGPTPNLPQYSFEVESLPDQVYSQLTFLTSVPIDTDQHDANPSAVIYDIITNPRGKLGIPDARLHQGSFEIAAQTLYNEGHGFSRSFEGSGSQMAKDLINEILQQIDAVIYEDPRDALIHLKLIRNDYDPNSLLVITPTNCEKITNFSAQAPVGVTNKVRVVYSNRQDGYLDDSAPVQNQANAVGQDGQTREAVLTFPGICGKLLATNVAYRELAALGRPLMKLRAECDRTFRNVVPGDCVKLNWPEWGISGAVFRVAGVNRGTLEDGVVLLDLIQDYYYNWAGLPPRLQGGTLISPPAFQRTRAL